MYHMKNFDFKKMQLWLGLTVLLGAGFLGLKFMNLIIMFMNLTIHLQVVHLVLPFIHLVGFHGGHVAFGLLSWITNINDSQFKTWIKPYTTHQSFMLLALYWHFIDVVWVFIFTVVYLMGMVG